MIVLLKYPTVYLTLHIVLFSNLVLVNSICCCNLKSRPSRLLVGGMKNREKVWSAAHVQVVDSAWKPAARLECSWVTTTVNTIVEPIQFYLQMDKHKRLSRDMIVLLILHYRFQWSHNIYYAWQYPKFHSTLHIVVKFSYCAIFQFLVLLSLICCYWIVIVWEVLI